MDMGAFVDKEFYKKSFSLIKVAQMISPTDIILITTIFDTFPLFDLDSCFSRWASLSFYNNWITISLISNDAIRSEFFSNIEYIKSTFDRLNWGWAMFLRCSYFFGNLSLNVLINMVLTQIKECSGWTMGGRYGQRGDTNSYFLFFLSR